MQGRVLRYLSGALHDLVLHAVKGRENKCKVFDMIELLLSALLFLQQTLLYERFTVTSHYSSNNDCMKWPHTTQLQPSKFSLKVKTNVDHKQLLGLIN